jgi:hypothetical protein
MVYSTQTKCSGLMIVAATSFLCDGLTLGEVNSLIREWCEARVEAGKHQLENADALHRQLKASRQRLEKCGPWHAAAVGVFSQHISHAQALGKSVQMQLLALAVHTADTAVLMIGVYHWLEHTTCSDAVDQLIPAQDALVPDGKRNWLQALCWNVAFALYNPKKTVFIADDYGIELGCPYQVATFSRDRLLKLVAYRTELRPVVRDMVWEILCCWLDFDDGLRQKAQIFCAFFRVSGGTGVFMMRCMKEVLTVQRLGWKFHQLPRCWGGL